MKRRKQQGSEDNNKKLYEPDKILEKKKEGTRYLYLVKWRGYNISEATWELYKNISHCTWLFDDWEEKQEKDLHKSLKQADQIIDKKYSNSNRVFYLVSLKKGGEDMWVQRKYLMVDHEKLVQDYEKNEGLLENKRKFQHKRYNKKEDRYMDSDESSQGSGSESGSDSDDDDNSGNDDNNETDEEDSSEINERDNSDEKVHKKRGGRQRGRGKQTKGRGRRGKRESDDSKHDDNNEGDEESDNDESESRRIVKVRRKKSKKILYEKLPFYGILGIDEPKKVKNMVIDKKVGLKEDGYFACDVVWKIRPNKQQPIDSRVSRKDIKEFYPLILIEYYEFNMTYNGEIENGDEDDDDYDYEQNNSNNKNKNNNQDDDDEDDDEYYQKLQKKKRNSGLNSRKMESNFKDDQDEDDDDEEEDDEREQDEGSNNSFFYTNHIYYGYAKTNEQKKYVKFDEKFFNNNQMEEMN